MRLTTRSWAIALAAVGLAALVGAFVALPMSACAQQQCALATLSSPDDDIDAAGRELLQSSARSVSCSVSGISNARAVKDLIAAKRRGVDVRVVQFQASPTPGDLHDQLTAAGIPVVVRPNEIADRDRFCLIDDRFVLTGTFGWDRPTPAGATALVFRDCADVIRRFQQAFAWMSRPIGGG